MTLPELQSIQKFVYVSSGSEGFFGVLSQQLTTREWVFLLRGDHEMASGSLVIIKQPIELIG